MELYSVSATVSYSASRDLLRISVPASPVDPMLPRSASLRVLKVSVAGTASATSQQLPISLHTASTLGTGDAATVVAFNGAPVFTSVMGGSAATNFSVDTTKSATLYQQGVDITAGFEWAENGDDKLLLPPGSNFVVRLSGAPSGATALSVSCVFALV